MSAETELKVPEVGESITEVHVGKWHKAVGDRVERDEAVVELESDKATVDLPAPAAGTISKILKQSGEMANVGEVIGLVAAGDTAAAEVKPAAAPPAETQEVFVEKRRGQTAIGSVRPSDSGTPAKAAAALPAAVTVMPAAEKILAQNNLSPNPVPATGPGGRLLKEDAQRYAESKGLTGGANSGGATAQPASATRPATAPTPASQAPANQSPVGEAKSHIASARPVPAPPAVSAPSARSIAPAERAEVALPAQAKYAREEEFVVMSPIRRRIAQRLVEAQQSAALLTTFNELDMTEVMALRNKHKEAYQQRYGVKLGFMSFFVKATIDALRLTPQVNAELREPHVVYRNYYDIGIAVGGGKGLVVPVLRNAEFMSFGEIELAIADFARRAADNKLKLEELQGGTFTISNGGVYGSLLSTPIVNPPQSGILGLHAIQDRPVARGGQVVIRPMMYVALTYDHRIIDGREAVTFLKRIKETIEDPSRILLEV
jgi:2-oxoglutarate dehydrogenase E2 component (dihydrolipoamide succinyltransferase)